MDSRGCRDSEAMVTGRAKRRGEEVNEEKEERRVGDAVESGCQSVIAM